MIPSSIQILTRPENFSTVIARLESMGMHRYAHDLSTNQDKLGYIWVKVYPGEGIFNASSGSMAGGPDNLDIKDNVFLSDSSSYIIRIKFGCCPIYEKIRNRLAQYQIKCPASPAGNSIEINLINRSYIWFIFPRESDIPGNIFLKESA